MVEKAESTNGVSVPNEPNEQTDQNAKAVSLRKQGLSYQQIANELNVSKSTAFRLVKDAGLSTQATTKRQVPLESFEGFPPLPNEPVEFMDDFELKDTAKRLKTELQIKRMRARARWLDYVSQNPQHYQSHTPHNGQGKGDNFRDRVMLEDRKMLMELIRDKGKSNESFGMKDFFNSVLNLQANQQKSNWEFYSHMVDALGNMKGSELPPDATIALKRMEQDFEKWKVEQQMSREKWENVAQIVGAAFGKLPDALQGFMGKKGAANPNKAVTQMQCKACGAVFPVALKALEERRPLTCSVCGAVHKPLVPEEIKDGKVEDNTSS